MRATGASRPPGPAPRRPSAAAGFTLFELAIVVLIIGLITTMVAPYFRGMRSTLIKGEVRRLAGRASFLYDQASSRKMVMRLTFDLDNNRYFVSRLDPYALNPLFALDGEPGATAVALPAEVRLRDVTVEGIGTLSRGTISCQFYPEGFVDATVVHMADVWGGLFTLSFDPLTGRVAIMRGDDNPFSRAGDRR